MPDPTLIIPGTQATTLSDIAGKVVYNAVRVALSPHLGSLGGWAKKDWVALLSMQHTPDVLAPKRTSLLEGMELQPAFVVQTPYALFPKYYEEWPYDWRADMRWTAQRLLDDLRDRTKPPGSARVNLIGHSQGGMLIILASKLARRGEFAQLVARAAIVGSPLAGTMVAAEALAFGSEGLGKQDRLRSRAMARTWPAIYQMCASWPSICEANGTPYPSAKQLLMRGGWPGAENSDIDDDLLKRARETAEILTDPLSNFGPGIAVRTFLGKNQTTGARLTRTAGKLIEIVDEGHAGDTLVHFGKTLEWAGKPFSYTVYPYDGATRPHAELCVDYTVSADIISFINQPAPQKPIA